MYCTNCGKETAKEDNFCNYCGTATNKRNSETEEMKKDDNAFSMRYFDFFKSWYLGFVIIVNFITIVGNDINFEDIQIIQLFIINMILYVAIPIKLVCDLDKKSKFIFYLLMAFFILDYALRIVVGTMSCVENDSETSFIIYLLLLTLIYGVWYIPNLTYFVKRRGLFVN